MPKRCTLEQAQELAPFPIVVLPAPPGILLDLDVLVPDESEPQGCVTLIYKPQDGAGSGAPSCITVVQGPGEFSLAPLGASTERVAETNVEVAVDPSGSEHANVMTAWKGADRGFGLSVEWFDSANADDEKRQTTLRIVGSVIEASAA